MKRPRKPKPSFKRSTCPIANTLDLLGDKWTLLVVRDLLLVHKSRYGELAESDESIPSNILADRLRRLEDTGVIVKQPYQTNPPRYAYQLTPKGVDLLPVLQEMVHWANKHIPGTYVPSPRFLNPKLKTT